MVFDSTLSGINNSLWDPNFILPSMGSLIIMVVPKTHMVDLYVGEMVYNFQLSPLLAQYCRVDLVSYLVHKKYHQGTHLWMRWVCPMMGLVLSPPVVIQGLLWASEVVRGNSSDPDNPFR